MKKHLDAEYRDLESVDEQPESAAVALKRKQEAEMWKAFKKGSHEVGGMSSN